MTAHSGVKPDESGKYTVPTIQHVPTNKYIMDSAAISQFIEETYPNPPLQMKSELGDKLVAQIWAELSKTFRESIMPREADILHPRSAEYFRNARGLSPDGRVDVEKEEEAWKAVDGTMRDIGEAMQTNKAQGPFVLGAVPTYADFVIAGAMQGGRMVDEGVFQRIVKHPGFRDVYEACLPYMEKRT
jgi:glutathione S-transferase